MTLFRMLWELDTRKHVYKLLQFRISPYLRQPKPKFFESSIYQHPTYSRCPRNSVGNGIPPDVYLPYFWLPSEFAWISAEFLGILKRKVSLNSTIFHVQRGKGEKRSKMVATIFNEFGIFQLGRGKGGNKGQGSVASIIPSSSFYPIILSSLFLPVLSLPRLFCHLSALSLSRPKFSQLQGSLLSATSPGKCEERTWKKPVYFSLW
jgi:hypothetical protein